jgi:hypothetical protein
MKKTGHYFMCCRKILLMRNMQRKAPTVGIKIRSRKGEETQYSGIIDWILGQESAIQCIHIRCFCTSQKNKSLILILRGKELSD